MHAFSPPGSHTTINAENASLEVGRSETCPRSQTAINPRQKQIRPQKMVSNCRNRVERPHTGVKLLQRTSLIRSYPERLEGGRIQATKQNAHQSSQPDAPPDFAGKSRNDRKFNKFAFLDSQVLLSRTQLNTLGRNAGIICRLKFPQD